MKMSSISAAKSVMTGMLKADVGFMEFVSR